MVMRVARSEGTRCDRKGDAGRQKHYWTSWARDTGVGGITMGDTPRRASRQQGGGYEAHWLGSGHWGSMHWASQTKVTGATDEGQDEASAGAR
ncbi:unnamed protein product [Ilex paraguariensis]|uniref:Uncharacterized protein n=1 Tax=Ilex paraguariensis TaxID=185542 RepID=A0ABC8UU47_9AQUA